MKKLWIWGLMLVAASLRAQSDPDAGRSFVPNWATCDPYDDYVELLRPALTPVSQGTSAIAEAYTADIQALAANLGGDPARIFDFVHDQIRYVHYFGSLKGAELTLLERSGNDFDQCALLSALLQASGYSPQYQFGWMKLPYDSTNHEDLHHWLGLALPDTDWTNKLNYFSLLLGSRGYASYIQFPNDTTNIAFQRVWVTLALSGTNYYLDPAFKVSEPVPGTNLALAMGLNTTSLLTAAGGTDTGYSVSGVSEGAVRTALTGYNKNLLAGLSNGLPNAAVAQVVGGWQIVPSRGSPLRTSVLFPLVTNSSHPLVNWTYQPTNYMGSVSLTLAGTNRTWLTPELKGQLVGLTFETNGIGQLWLEDAVVLQTGNAGASNTVDVVLTVRHPYNGYDSSSTNAYQRTNASYAIIYAFDASPQWLQARQQKLEAYQAQNQPSTSPQVTLETLNVMGLGWMVQTELCLDLIAQQWGHLPHHHHRFGRMGQEKNRGYYVDVYMQADSTLPNTGWTAPDQLGACQVFDVSSYFWSAMEHGIIEQLQGSNLVASSTVKMLEIASTNSQTVYLASAANWNSPPNIHSNLTNYGSTLSRLDDLIGQGFVLLLPKNGSNQVAGAGSWAGNGYVELAWTAMTRTMGTIITGGYHGGYAADPFAMIDPPFVNFTAEQLQTFFAPLPPTSQSPPRFGADPVNLVDGSFQFSATDLSLGPPEPRGLQLARYYSSARRNSNAAAMAPGWLHSYYGAAAPISDPEVGLGAGTVQQMTPLIVATCAALNLYISTNPDPKNWTVTALIIKWGVDQLINNAVSVSLGNNTLEFARQPDGSYTPPANCTMSLIRTNGGYWLQERHGRTFKFGTAGALTDVVDPYGQDMSLTYFASNQVKQVTDSNRRTLSFNYTGGVLTSVADSAGRSVYYGYTGGDLTSFTDPELATNRYAYDTNHLIVATYDALDRVVVTNVYDAFGRITTQLTAGDPNKAWQVFASGYDTVEIDPAGDQRVLAYDAKSRLIASQDGMGNVTWTVYDGQDHAIQTVSPRGETNRFLYDANNNLVETIDPLGFSNVFTFDSQNRLITSTDASGNASHFGYNSQFSLTAVTNGNGEVASSRYNTDGTLGGRWDSGGGVGYGYDSYGQVNSITYSNGLGSETFLNNACGDPTNHTDARNIGTASAYNHRRQLTSTVTAGVANSIAYDANGNVWKTTDGRGFVTSNTWSVTRHLLATTMPPTAQGTPTVTNGYDARDWLACTANPLGKLTYFTNDAAHRLVATSDPLNRTNVFGYDQDGHQTMTIDPLSHQTTQTWDARGQVIRVLDAATNLVGRTYDAAGNLAYLTNRNTNVWHFLYDGANRLTNTATPLSHSTTLSFNNRGLLQSATDPLNHQVSFVYDGRGRLTNRTDNVGTNLYYYDGNNNLTLVTNAGAGARLAWAYDAWNRPTNFTSAAGFAIQYRYDASGNLTNLIYPGNRTVKYFYDANNRLTNATDWAQRQTSFAYDLAGRLTNVFRPNNTLRAMAYDDAGQLTNIVERTTTQFPIAFHTLHYDLAGRMDWEFKAPLPHPFTPPARNMSYDVENRLTSVNSTNVIVDADGNLTYGPLTNSAFTTHNYDARNQLTAAGGVTYGYDPAGNRVAMTNAGVATSLVIDPLSSQALMRIRSNVTNYYLYGAGGLIYEIDESATATNTAFYHFDCRGSTVALTDAGGNPTDVIEYSAYGLTTYRAGTNNTPFLYNGQFGVQTDPNGLLFMRARYYNPYICRFINPDPAGFGGGLNFYCFAGGNPISLADPFGLCPADNSTAPGLFNPNVGKASGGYVDAFGNWHPTFCYACHDPTDPNALFYKQQSQLANSQSWAIFAYQQTLGLVVSVVGGGIASDIAGAAELSTVARAADSGLIGVTSGESSALARQIYGIEVNGQPAVSSIEAFGSRAGSTFRGRGPLPTSDLDIIVTLNESAANPAGLATVNNQLGEIGSMFQRAKGFPVNAIVKIPGLPPVKPSLLQTPFIPLKP